MERRDAGAPATPIVRSINAALVESDWPRGPPSAKAVAASHQLAPADRAQPCVPAGSVALVECRQM